MKKILVPIDFSHNSKNALRFAAEVAVKNGASLELLHANVAAIYSVPLSEYASATVYAEDRNYDESASRLLERTKHELFENPAFAKLKVDTRVEEGYLHSCIRNVAQEDEVDLVVMGTKGAAGVNEFLVGSNTEKVIRTAPCPVLAVPENTEKFTIKTVLLPSTLKDDQKGIFNYLAEWQKVFGFNVKVLYLNNPSGFPTDGSAEAAKNRLAEAAGLTKLEVIMAMGSFFEDSTILSVADQYDVDMIAMATHQRHGLSHVFFGSITEDTVNHSNIPVLAVPIAWKKS
ncbi:MAG: universal stress protein [Haliscomenobacteraceae bacterium CHB4]|nr:universal stress protein [Haliscomenobacteraceae bacterium CHB4]